MGGHLDIHMRQCLMEIFSEFRWSHLKDNFCEVTVFTVVPWGRALKYNKLVDTLRPNNNRVASRFQVCHGLLI